MKGKTGKSAMRGGGIARKGKGMALKGGGIARKGVGMALADGGVSKAMTKFPNKTKGGIGMGGSFGSGPQTALASGRPAPKTALASGRPSGSSRFKEGGKIKKMAVGGPTAPATPPVATPAVLPPMARPGFRHDGKPLGPMGNGFGRSPSSFSARSEAGVYDRMANMMANRDRMMARPSAPTTPQLTGGPASPTTPPTVAKKHGGKVAKYAKGGSVKMTAGAGSGSGRLEKVAAHKAAPRVKAVGLKKGGKVKGK